MTYYYAFYPRNFCNEYTIYGAESAEAKSEADTTIQNYANDINASFERISRDAARRMSKKYYSIDDMLAKSLPILCSNVEADYCMRDYTGQKLIPGRDF